MDEYTLIYENIRQRLQKLDAQWGIHSCLVFESNPTIFEKICSLMEGECFSSQALLQALEPFMQELFENSLDEQIAQVISDVKNTTQISQSLVNYSFLEFVYDYCRYLSFPESITILQDKILENGAELLLQFYQVLSQVEKKTEGKRFYQRYPMDFLRGEEERELTKTSDYFVFKEYFNRSYIFEMLKLSQEIKGYTTLDHISGVCYISLYIARQLKKAGIPIDLGVVTAASMGHDIGKFGAKKGEERRIPYLHYYYTDHWFASRGMPFVGKVAANHSTWDLELENLQVESLVLIYADFRVKSLEKNMHIYDLKSSFQVILDKLDNVDEEKENRYRRIYAKLVDFEDYLKFLGIDIELKREGQISSQPTKEAVLLYGNEITQNIKYQAINYNINILKNFTSLESFNELLVNLGSEKDWKKLREYISIFNEYYKYIGKKQKQLLLAVLQDLLLFKEEDVRNQGAEIIGIMIANFDEEYRKEIPDYAVIPVDELSSQELFDKYLSYFLYKDHKQTERNIEWLRINAKNMVRSLFLTTKRPEQFHKIIDMHLEKIMNLNDANVTLAMTQVLKHVSLARMNHKGKLYRFLETYYNDQDTENQLAVSKIIYILSRFSGKTEEDREFASRIVDLTVRSDNPVVDYLRIALLNEMNRSYQVEVKDKILLLGERQLSKKVIGEIYLKNLKSATGWIEKKANIDVMVDHLLLGKTTNNLQTALHFCNLLKVSSTESVRNHSGKAIVKIVDSLPEQEKNEVAIELIRALEMQDIQFTKYIPKYVGEVLTYLEPGELDEALDDFYVKVKTSTSQLTWLILMSVGHCLESYLACDYSRDKNANLFQKRLEKMLGILMIGLYNINSSINHETLKIISNLFGSEKLSLKQKASLYQLINKRLLNYFSEIEASEEVYIKNAASLNKIYRFISEFEFSVGPLVGQSSTKIAFFPGTFDPFSLSHKAIAKEIREMGYDVFLSIDEFSWSKKAQPNGIRRDIIKLSIADEGNIYIFPAKYPINIANDQDIIKLQKLFQGKELSLVVGSDVVENASSYRKEKNGKVLDLDHIIFYRQKDDKVAEEEKQTHLINVEQIRGKVTLLSLAQQYEGISSTLIREAVDEDRDISELIDYQAQNYIYRFSLYKKAPQFKYFAPREIINTQIVENLDEKMYEEFLKEADFSDAKERKSIIKKVFSRSETKNIKSVILRDYQSGKIIGFATGFCLKSQDFYKEFGDLMISEYLRNHGVGRIIMINSHWYNPEYSINNLTQINLTEILSVALERDYSYCVFNNAIQRQMDSVEKVLKAQGFILLNAEDESTRVFAAKMTNPIILNPDLRSIIKEPFRNHPHVKQVIYKTREKLQLALAKLFPGELVLSFDRKTTYSKLVKKVCDINEVSNIPTNPRVLGDKICVSYGTILNGTIVPNTVTKSLHTEKVYQSDLQGFEIEQYPNYMDIGVQIDYIKSFDRPVILIDDILHKGYRIKKMGPMFSQNNVSVEKLVVAILSGRGREIIDSQGSNIEYIYYLPNIKNWFNENSMYPFVGGDYVKREGQKESFLVPSLNYILPYAYPAFIRRAKKEDIYGLSKVCLSNAVEFFETIESVYQEMYEKSFSLYKLREVFEKTRMPDYGKSFELDLSLKPSDYIKNDLEKLKRIKRLFSDH